MSTLAYRHAGSGSMIPQAVARGFAGFAVFAKYRWHWKRQWMRTCSGPETEQSAARFSDEIDELSAEIHEPAEAGG